MIGLPRERKVGFLMLGKSNLCVIAVEFSSWLLQLC